MMDMAKEYDKIFEERVEGITGGTYCMNCNTMLLSTKDEQNSHKARGHNIQKMDLVFRKSIFKMFDDVKRTYKHSNRR